VRIGGAGLAGLGGYVYIHGEFLARAQDFVAVDSIPAGYLVYADAELAGDDVEGVAVSYCVAEFAGGVAEGLGWRSAWCRDCRVGPYDQFLADG